MMKRLSEDEDTYNTIPNTHNILILDIYNRETFFGGCFTDLVSICLRSIPVSLNVVCQLVSQLVSRNVEINGMMT